MYHMYNYTGSVPTVFDLLVYCCKKEFQECDHSFTSPLSLFLPQSVSFTAVSSSPDTMIIITVNTTTQQEIRLLQKETNYA